MSSITFSISDPSGLSATVRVVEITAPDGTTYLDFSIDVDESTGQFGELNGVFFDLAGAIGDDTLTTDALKIVSGEESVSNLGGGVNVKGEVAKTYGDFDAGVLVDETGLAGHYNDGSYDFSVALDGGSLTLADLLGQDFALRLTSVGEDGSQDGSLKLGGTVPTEADPEVVEEPAPVPTDETDPATDPDNTTDTDPTPDPETEPDPAPTPVAVDDVMTVSETETFNFGDPDSPPVMDTLDNGMMSLLANDTFDFAPYGGEVTSFNGSGDLAQIFLGSNGGMILVMPDGSVDFSASDFDGNNAFADLNDGEQQSTTFEYSIEGGSTANLSVNVLGIGGTGDTTTTPIDDGSINF